MTGLGLQDIYFTMFDVEAAFKQIRIHPDDWIYLVVAWQRTKDGEREWYIDLALPFGIRVGPKIFNLFGDLLHFIGMCLWMISAPSQEFSVGRQRLSNMG